MADDGGESSAMSTMMIGSGCATLALASGLAYVMSRRGGKRSRDGSANAVEDVKEEKHEELDHEQYPGGHLTVYFGSQTGTAESFAQILAREGESDRGFKVRVVDLEDAEDDLDGHILDERFRDADGRNRAVFLMATYGEGEPTDNAAAFVRLLKAKAGMKTGGAGGYMGTADDFAEEKKGDGDEVGDDADGEADPSFMSGLDYAVFGLGNRQYEHFNAMGKLTDEALAKIGASRLAELGVGDDDNDLEADFENWKDNVLWPALEKRYIGDAATVAAKHEHMHKSEVASASDDLPECPYVAEYLPPGSADAGSIKPDAVRLEDVHTSTKHYFTAVDCPVRVTRELRTDRDPGSTVHLEIDISKAGDAMRYRTADNLGVLPVNDDGVVEAVAGALGLDLDAAFRLKLAQDGGGGGDEEEQHKHSALFPTPCTVRECLARYCDLTAPPRRSDLKRLASYARDPLDRSALLRMASKEGKAEYREKIVGGHVGVADIVSRLCPSIAMPLEHFVAVCPRLLPRYYTISSSSSVHPDSIHITVSVIRTEKLGGGVHRGVCSSHLAGIVENGTVRVFCRESSFRLPSDPGRPVIMIGPGTGIAPMRALLQERSHQRKKRRLPVGKNVLYFGCKTPTQDYLYEEELSQFKREGTLDDLRVAFSRTTTKKVYVQHLLAKNAEETYEMIEEKKASVYVCGGTKMGHDVSETLRSIVSDVGGMSHEEAKKYLDEMSKEGRFVQELWSA